MQTPITEIAESIPAMIAKAGRGQRMWVFVSGTRRGLKGQFIALHPSGILELKRWNARTFVKVDAITAVKFCGIWGY